MRLRVSRVTSRLVKGSARIAGVRGFVRPLREWRFGHGAVGFHAAGAGLWGPVARFPAPLTGPSLGRTSGVPAPQRRVADRLRDRSPSVGR